MDFALWLEATDTAPVFWDFPNAIDSVDHHNAEAIAEVQRWISGDVPRPSRPGRHVREQ